MGSCVDLLREFIALLRPKNLVFLQQFSPASFRFIGCIVTLDGELNLEDRRKDLILLHIRIN